VSIVAPERPPRAGARPHVAPARRFARALVGPAIVALALAAIAWASEQTPDVTVQGSPSATSDPVAGAASEAPPVPSGGYVFAGGALVADAQAKTLTLTLWKGCGTRAATRAMPVVDGRFHFTGSAAGQPSVRLRVVGRFITTDRARATIVRSGPGCPRRAFDVVAVLS
jgi:hypothetical protein